MAKAEQQRALNAARQAQAASKADTDAALAQADAAEFQAAVEKARLDRQKQIDEAWPSMLHSFFPLGTRIKLSF